MATTNWKLRKFNNYTYYISDGADDICQLSNFEGNSPQTRKSDSDKEAGKYWFDKGNKYYDLNADIANGNFDI